MIFTIFISIWRSASLYRFYIAPQKLIENLYSESGEKYLDNFFDSYSQNSSLLESSITNGINICYVNQYYVFPSHFLFPSIIQFKNRNIPLYVHFSPLKSFGYLVPTLYSISQNSFSRIVPNTNSLNKEIFSNYIPLESCHLVIDVIESFEPYLQTFNKTLNRSPSHCVKLLNRDLTPNFLRWLYIPLISVKYAHFSNFCVFSFYQ